MVITFTAAVVPANSASLSFGHCNIIKISKKWLNKSNGEMIKSFWLKNRFHFNVNHINNELFDRIASYSQHNSIGWEFWTEGQQLGSAIIPHIYGSFCKLHVDNTIGHHYLSKVDNRTMGYMAPYIHWKWNQIWYWRKKFNVNRSFNFASVNTSTYIGRFVF